MCYVLISLWRCLYDMEWNGLWRMVLAFTNVLSFIDIDIVGLQNAKAKTWNISKDQSLITETEGHFSSFRRSYLTDIIWILLRPRQTTELARFQFSKKCRENLIYLSFVWCSWAKPLWHPRPINGLTWPDSKWRATLASIFFYLNPSLPFIYWAI